MEFFCTWLVLTAKDAFSNMIAACSPGYGTPDRTITSKLSDKADGGAGYKTFHRDFVFKPLGKLGASFDSFP